MHLKKFNILLADDDLDDCNFFRQALLQLSADSQLTIVHDGDALMQYLHENEEQLPQVLFLDINMPRKSGQECLMEMKKNERFQEIAVDIFSTSNSSETINKLFKIGAHVYIHKPSDFGQLKQVIYHALPIAAEKKNSNGPLNYILNA